MAKEKDIDDLAEHFQRSCHETVSYVMKHQKTLPDNGSVQDATNVWLFRKLAELQIEINELKNK